MERLRPLLALVIGLGLAAGCLTLFDPCSGQEYDPVCGSDGNTYDNACLAEQAGVSVEYGGACTTEPVCSETDGGKNVMSAGTVTISGGSQFTDDCVGESTVLEYFCSGGAADSERIDCPVNYACMNGACVLSEEDEEPADEGGASCTDTESETSIYAAGTVTVTNGSGSFTFTDGCSDVYTVTEYSCDGDTVSSSTQRCPEGYSCLDGACFSADSCYDSDGGGSGEIYVEGVVFSEYDSYSDYCTGDSTLREFSCVAGSRISETETCPSGYVCQSGHCTPADECYENDDGRDYYERGTTFSDDEERTDYCTDGNTLREYYCSDGILLDRYFDCPSGYICNGGECERSDEEDECDDDGDCPAGMECVGGDCVDTESECDDDADCGAGEICSGGDCVDDPAVECVGDDDCPAGTVCVDEECVECADDADCDGDDVCSDGECVEPGCDDDADCPEGMECDAGECVAVEEPVCVDDDGDDIHTSGTVTFDGESEDDYCTDFGAVVEWVCYDDPTEGYHALEEEFCPDGEYCSNGRCRDTWCTDGDSDSIIPTREKSRAKDYTGTMEWDTCEDGSTLREFSCDADDRVYSELHVCDGYCEDGACHSHECSDTDGGRDEFTAGTAESTDGSSGTDYCGDFLIGVNEYYCDGSSVELSYIECPDNYLCEATESGGECAPRCTEDGSGNVQFGDDYYRDTCKGDDVKDYRCDGDYDFEVVLVDCPPFSPCMETITGAECS